MYDRHATDNQSAETDEESLSGEQSGTTPSTSMNSSTQETSNDVIAGKDTNISENITIVPTVPKNHFFHASNGDVTTASYLDYQ